MAFPPAFLEELRARLPLSEVVGKRMRLVRAGREFAAPCPFHHEKTPSFTVNDQKGFFHCFGCGAHGDIIGFTMRHDHLTFPEAVESLAGLAGLSVPRQAPEDIRRYERQKSLHEVVEAATAWFEQQLRLPWGAAALAYLQRRGLDDEAIAAFRLGYAPPEGAALRTALERAGFSVSDMLEAGLVKRPDDGRAPYSFFRHRVMFPVSDRRGRAVAFGGRLIEGDGPKYINTGETPLFHKGHLLYGLSRARLAAAEGKPVILVEGYMDVIALVRAGYPGAVAPLGTALTETQIEVVWKLFSGREKMPVLCFDGDNAGKRAAFRAVERILPMLMPDQSIRVAFLPSGEDPDSLIRSRGAAAMEAVLARASSLADVLWEMETAGRRFDTPEAKAGLEAVLNERVGLIAERAVQSCYREDMKRRLREAFRWRPPERDSRSKSAIGARSALRAGRPGPRPLALPPVQTPMMIPRRPSRLRAEVFLAALINHPALIDEYGERLVELEIADPLLSELRRALIRLWGEHHAFEPATLRTRLEAEGFAELFEQLFCRSVLETYYFIRSDAEPESVRAGLAEILRLLALEALVGELPQAGQRYRQDLTLQNCFRVESLRSELAVSVAFFDDPD
ncbi:MAG: DNA primase [Rhodospirillaceae bacterium]